MSALAKIEANQAAQFLIEPMSEHDLLEVVEIEREAEISPWGWDAYYNDLIKPESIMLVARGPSNSDQGISEVVGFLAARTVADEFQINNVAVRMCCRRMGVASALLRYSFESAANVGCRTAFLEVRASNKAARKTYRRFGFHVIGRRTDYYSSPIEDAILMSAFVGSIT
jgi:ribosomal-protein-alanine N-acetyltransferase